MMLVLCHVRNLTSSERHSAQREMAIREMAKDHEWWCSARIDLVSNARAMEYNKP